MPVARIPQPCQPPLSNTLPHSDPHWLCFWATQAGSAELQAEPVAPHPVETVMSPVVTAPEHSSFLFTKCHNGMSYFGMPSGRHHWLTGNIESYPRRALSSAAEWTDLSLLPNDPLQEMWERQCVQSRKDCQAGAEPAECNWLPLPSTLICRLCAGLPSVPGPAGIPSNSRPPHSHATHGATSGDRGRGSSVPRAF